MTLPLSDSINRTITLQDTPARIEGKGISSACPPKVYAKVERLGYFSIDPDSDLEPPVPSQRKLVFNRTITLKDTWAKEAKKGN